MERVDQELVELEQGLAAGAHDKGTRPIGVDRGPSLRHRLREFGGSGKASTTGAVGPDKVGVTEPADCPRAIFVPSGPEVASGETAENGRSSRVRTLSLQRVEEFLDRVAHTATLASLRYGMGSFKRFSVKPLSL